jgi:hypothetical protein
MNWRRLLFENYGAKLALLLMAVFLWFFVVTSREYHHVISVPINLVGMMEDKVFIDQPDAHARVNFKGKGTSLLLLSLFGDVRLELNITTINYYYDFPVRLDQVKWAPGINVDIIEILRPDTVFIRLDDEVVQTIKIKPMLTVNTARDYTVMGELRLVPDTVRVRGAKSIIESLDYIPTQVKTFENADNSISTKLDLIPPEQGTIVLEPEEVRAYWTIEKIETRLITGLPVNVINTSPGETSFCDPSSIDIWVKAPKSRLDTLNTNNILITVSTEGRISGGGIFTPVVHLPEKIELISTIPDSIQVNYVESEP